MAEVFHRIRMAIPEGAILAHLVGERRLTNLPRDARIVSMHVDAEWFDGTELNRRLALVLEHPSFPPTIAGHRIPRRRAQYRPV